MKNSLFILVLLSVLFTSSCSSCKKSDACFDDLPNPTSSYPVWHPNGQILGFNRTPLKRIIPTDQLCLGVGYSYYDDSTGFWLINKDGTGLRRVTTYQLLFPSWSPDGKWIAFCNRGIIYKMAFDGINFDTTHVITLTESGARSFPSWNITSDTIYYLEQISDGFSYLFKMSADGIGKSLIDSGGFGSCYYSNSQILYIRVHSNQVFSMDPDGSNKKQITTDTLTNSLSFQKEYPQYYNHKIYFEFYGIYSINEDGSGLMQLCTPSTQGYSISKDGTIAYVNFGYNALSKELGTVWLMESDGTNRRQLTHQYIP